MMSKETGVHYCYLVTRDKGLSPFVCSSNSNDLSPSNK